LALDDVGLLAGLLTVLLAGFVFDLGFAAPALVFFSLLIDESFLLAAAVAFLAGVFFAAAFAFAVGVVPVTAFK
jgi:hypothetical protein